jgi:hypothetical protein
MSLIWGMIRWKQSKVWFRHLCLNVEENLINSSIILFYQALIQCTKTSWSSTKYIYNILQIYATLARNTWLHRFIQLVLIIGSDYVYEARVICNTAEFNFRILYNCKLNDRCLSSVNGNTMKKKSGSFNIQFNSCDRWQVYKSYWLCYFWKYVTDVNNC